MQQRLLGIQSNRIRMEASQQGKSHWTGRMQQKFFPRIRSQKAQRRKDGGPNIAERSQDSSGFVRAATSHTKPLAMIQKLLQVAPLEVFIIGSLIDVALSFAPARSTY